MSKKTFCTKSQYSRNKNSICTHQHLYNEILYHHKKDEILAFAATQIDLEIISFAKRIQIQEKSTEKSHLYVVSKKLDVFETEYKMVVCRGS